MIRRLRCWSSRNDSLNRRLRKSQNADVTSIYVVVFFETSAADRIIPPPRSLSTAGQSSSEEIVGLQLVTEKIAAHVACKRANLEDARFRMLPSGKVLEA